MSGDVALAEAQAECARLRSLVAALVVEAKVPPTVETYYRVIARGTHYNNGSPYTFPPCKTLGTALRKAADMADRGCSGWVEKAVLTWERVEGAEYGVDVK